MFSYSIFLCIHAGFLTLLVDLGSAVMDTSKGVAADVFKARVDKSILVQSGSSP